MKKALSRCIALIAVCGMLVALLAYSPAMAEDLIEASQEDNICTADTLDTGTSDELLVSSDAIDSYDPEPSSCMFYCETASDCPRKPAGPYYCSNYCCIAY